jgi:membrane protein YqaA with SNARE-associated domain
MTEPNTATGTETINKDTPPGIVRRIYDWVLAWADHPGGVWALFLLAFAESSFFPIPPDVLLIALCIGKPSRSLWFATVCSIGSIVGGIAGYLIGAGFWHALDTYFYTYVPGLTPASFARVQGLYDTWNFWIVFTAGFTPLPYKLFTISAGVFGISFPMFLIASAVSRSARFFLVAGLIQRFGPSIKGFIDRYFNLLAIGFTVLLVSGFIVVKLLL